MLFLSLVQEYLAKPNGFTGLFLFFSSIYAPIPSLPSREALASQELTLAVHESKAVLQVHSGSQAPLTFNLRRLPASETKKQLQELMFGLAKQVQTLEKRLQGTVGPQDTLQDPLWKPNAREGRSSEASQMCPGGL